LNLLAILYDKFVFYSILLVVKLIPPREVILSMSSHLSPFIRTKCELIQMIVFCQASFQSVSLGLL